MTLSTNLLAGLAAGLCWSDGGGEHPGVGHVKERVGGVDRDVGQTHTGRKYAAADFRKASYWQARCKLECRRSGSSSTRMQVVPPT